jgi:hypothetical protein
MELWKAEEGGMRGLLLVEIWAGGRHVGLILVV